MESRGDGRSVSIAVVSNIAFKRRKDCEIFTVEIAIFVSTMCVLFYEMCESESPTTLQVSLATRSVRDMLWQCSRIG